jgi:hypothetical protein
VPATDPLTGVGGSGEERVRTNVAGWYPANPWGLFDKHGCNVQ